VSRKELQVSAITFGSRAPVARFLATGAALTLAAWGLGLTVTRIGASATGELSLDLFLARHRSVALSQIALVIDVLLGVSVAPIVLLTIAGLVGKLWHWVAGALVVVVTGVGWVAAAVGKLLVHRSRPPGGVLHALVSETGIDSYPSGHTAFAAGLLASAVLIAYIFGRSAIRTAVLGLPGLVVVGVSRLYLGVHYIADVLGSCLIASASTLLLIGTYNAGWRLLRRSANPVTSSSESDEALASIFHRTVSGRCDGLRITVWD
jgi:membrane-associated phospholipid phosphatase